MKILVTGGAGFIGSNFVHYLIKNRLNFVDSIVVYDALTYAGNLENLATVMDKIEFVKGDICNADLFSHVLKQYKIDAIVNFAAESHVDRSILGAQDFVKTNVVGTQTLIDCAQKHGIKIFVHVSTDEVFGDLELDSTEKFKEDTPYNPSSAYSASKAGSDLLVKAACRTFNFPGIITNCANNYGSYMFPEKLMPLFITNLIDDKKVPLYGDGLNIRDWIHVNDHCAAIALVLEKGKIGETYCIGSNNEQNNIQITKKILYLMNKGEEYIEYVPDRKGHDRRYAIDSSKIQNELHWRPQINFDQGLKQMVDWYVEHQDWWRRVKSGEYMKYYENNYGKKL